MNKELNITTILQDIVLVNKIELDLVKLKINKELKTQKKKTIIKILKRSCNIPLKVL